MGVMDKETPRELTVEEAQEAWLVMMWGLVDYWDKLEDITPGQPQYGAPEIRNTQRHRLEGLLHSFLASGIDGCGLSTPAMELKPIVSEESIEFHKTQNNDPNFMLPIHWFPPGKDIGGLHSLMYKVGRKHGFVKDE